MTNLPIKLLLVEDHKLMRVGLKSLFEEQGGLEVTSEAENGKEAIEKFRTTHPDVTLMDIGLPDISGIEATKRILELNTKIIPYQLSHLQFTHKPKLNIMIINEEKL
jgi:DNA-binding NarL/FixJ family response regulator